jgi:hypothetical protein
MGVDLGLRPGHDLEPAMQPAQRIVVDLLVLGGDPGPPGLVQDHLDPLVVAGEAVLGDQPLESPCPSTTHRFAATPPPAG